MLQKCYRYIGSRYTLSGEVHQQMRYIGRRCTSAGEIPHQARVCLGAGVCAQVYTRDASCELQAVTRAKDELRAEKGANHMTTHERAVAFAKKVEQNKRIKELAQKQDQEGLTDQELDEFISRLDRIHMNYR